MMILIMTSWIWWWFNHRLPSRANEYGPYPKESMATWTGNLTGYNSRRPYPANIWLQRFINWVVNGMFDMSLVNMESHHGFRIHHGFLGQQVMTKLIVEPAVEKSERTTSSSLIGVHLVASLVRKKKKHPQLGTMRRNSYYIGIPMITNGKWYREWWDLTHSHMCVSKGRSERIVSSVVEYS